MTIKEIKKDEYVGGRECVVNASRDLGIDSNARDFIGKKCIILKRCKNGLIQVSLSDKPEKVISIPQYNLDLV